VILLVDIGNTSAKFRYYSISEGEFCFHHQFVIELQTLTDHILAQTLDEADKVIVAGVSSQLHINSIESWANGKGIQCVQIFTERAKFGVTCIYEDPSKFGVDRWLALLGAKQRYPDNDCLIVDAGTATNIELLARTGKQLGGWILPGLELLQTSLFNATEKVLGKAEYISDVTAGTNTQKCVSHGALLSTTGAIEKAYQKYYQDMPSLKLIVTGGNADIVASQLSIPHVIDQELLFKGMALYC